MIEKLKKVFAVVNDNSHETIETKKSRFTIKGIVALLLGVCALILSLINLFTKMYFMMVSTLIMTATFSICALLLLKFKKETLSEVLIALTIVIVFTYYALHGQNEGFAILWILLAPAIATLFFSFKRGIVVSTYFFLLLIFIFYAPLLFPQLKEIIPAYKNNTPGYYEQFRIRYPVLYFSSFLISVFLNTQKIYYSKIAERNSISDEMTELKNRRYYSDFIAHIGLESKVENDFTILSIDINNLKHINDTQGHDQGDKAIIGTSNILKKVFGEITENIYRTGGDEFFVFFNDPENNLDDYIDQLNKLASKTKIGDETLSFSVGTVKGREYFGSPFKELLNIAEYNMYKNKQKYYEKHQNERRRYRE